MSTTHRTAAAPRERGQRVPVGLLAAYPTLRQAARMIGVHASSLSRRELAVEHAGREVRLPPRLVLELAAYYRRRDEYEVGGALVDYALAHAPDRVGEIEEEIERYFEGTSDRDAPLDTESFLEEARRHLPPALYAQVERAYQANHVSPEAGTPSTEPGTQPAPRRGGSRSR
jgi:hypothetical protein